jgi:hypothetical protein
MAYGKKSKAYGGNQKATAYAGSQRQWGDSTGSEWSTDGPSWVVSKPEEPQPAAEASKQAITLAAPKTLEKSPEEILKEQIDEKLKDWPWKGVPKQLVTLV